MSWLAERPTRHSGVVAKEELAAWLPLGTVPPGWGTKLEVARVYEAVPLSWGSSEARFWLASPSSVTSVPRASSSVGWCARAARSASARVRTWVVATASGIGRFSASSARAAPSSASPIRQRPARRRRFMLASLVTEGVDGIELRGLAGGIEAEHHADQATEADGDDDDVGAHQGGPAEFGGQLSGGEDPQRHPDDPARHR